MTDEKERVALLPCPFCKSDAIITVETENYRQEQCEACFAMGPRRTHYDDRPSGWNTRALQAKARIVKRAK